MHSHRLARALAGAALAIGSVLGCAPERAPLAPPARRADLLSTLASPVTSPVEESAEALGPSASATWSLPALRRNAPLRADVTVSAVIGPRGGRIEIPAAGFALEVPAGAVVLPTSFTVTALAGDLLAYEFGPDGATFAVPLVATQDLKVTQAQRLSKRASLRAGYFRSASDLDWASARATVAQESGATVSPSGQRLSFRIPHFSGWIILWRDGEPADSTETP